MRAGAIVFLVFFAGAGLVLFTDVLDSPSGRSTKGVGARPPAGDATEEETGGDEEEPKPKPLTIEQKVAALEESVADLRRRARNVGDSTAALAGTDRALAAIQARLDELTKNAGRLPRNDVATQLDAIERDFELRELMVSGTHEVLEKGPDDVRKSVAALRMSAGELRAAATDNAALIARLDKVVGALDKIVAPSGGSAATEMNAVKQARARFDRDVSALRARLG